MFSSADQFLDIFLDLQFLPNRPLGRFGLVVAMSIYLLPVPLQVNFLRPWTGVEGHSSMDWCGLSVALAWSPKNGELFQNGRNFFAPLISLMWSLYLLFHPQFPFIGPKTIPKRAQ